MTRLGALVLFVAAVVPLAAAAKDPATPRSLVSCADFPSHEEIGALLGSMESDAPDIARRLVIGQSCFGLEIWALRVSADPDVESAEPEIRLVGGIHGNECNSVDLVLAIAEWLVGGWGDDPEATKLVDQAEIVLVPVINPDGYSSVNAKRVNAHGVDLNRNFHFAWVGEGEAPFSEPETRAVRDLSESSSFQIGITYHTVAGYVNSTWNYTPHHPPDADLLQAIGEAYAGESGYSAVFGWDWYEISGDLNDWSLGTTGAFDWTIELRSDRDLEWPIHKDGLTAFLSFAFLGAQGRVTDAITGTPIAARIEVAPGGAPVFNDPDVGDYHRILLPGTYSLTASATGYADLVRDDVAVPEDGAVEVDFALSPADPRTPRFAFAVTGMTLPKEIADDVYTPEEYRNRTLPWAALGPPDGAGYSLSPGGSVTLDFGAGSEIKDNDGAEVLVVSATGSDDPADVLVAAAEDGPWFEVASGSGTLEADIGGSGLGAIRYVRVEDTGDGEFEAELSGYDLDAIVDLSRGPYEPPDAGAPEDGGAPDGGLDLTLRVGGCDCGAAGAEARLSSGSIMTFLATTWDYHSGMSGEEGKTWAQ